MQDNESSQNSQSYLSFSDSNASTVRQNSIVYKQDGQEEKILADLDCSNQDDTLKMVSSISKRKPKISIINEQEDSKEEQPRIITHVGEQQSILNIHGNVHSISQRQNDTVQFEDDQNQPNPQIFIQQESNRLPAPSLNKNTSENTSNILKKQKIRLQSDEEEQQRESIIIHRITPFVNTHLEINIEQQGDQLNLQFQQQQALQQNLQQPAQMDQKIPDKDILVLDDLIENQLNKSQEKQEEAKEQLSFEKQCEQNFQMLNQRMNKQLITDFNDQEIEEELNRIDIRDYQQQIYLQGRDQNSIIYLETGTGKTIIMMMLMWHQICWKPDKKVIFLAQTVQLIEQQGRQFQRKIQRIAELLEDQYPNIVDPVAHANQIVKNTRIFHGQRFPDNYSGNKWKSIFEDSPVLFLTHQILLNCLRRGFIRMNQISLLCFDECHATDKKNPYNLIMTEYYFRQKYAHPNLSLPQIVGATSSPVINSKSTDQKSVLNDMIQLCSNLDSTFLYVDRAQLGQYLSNAEVIYKKYLPPFNSMMAVGFVEQQQGDQDLQKEILQIIRDQGLLQEYDQIEQFLKSLHAQQSDIAAKMLIQQIYRHLLQVGALVILELGFAGYLVLVQEVVEILNDKKKIEPPSLHEIALQISQMLGGIQQQLDQKIANNPQFAYSSKFQIVQQFLLSSDKLNQQQISNNDGLIQDMILIFTQQRIIAHVMTQTLRRFLNEKGSNLKVDYIIGQQQRQNTTKVKAIETVKDISGKITQNKLDQLKSQLNVEELIVNAPIKVKNKLFLKFSHTKQTNQLEILEGFRQRKIQILVSTSVAEEGIDIPFCNFVICFNSLSNSKSFVQMKGRARQSNSKFVILIPNQEEKQKTQVQELVQEFTREGIKQMSQRKDQILKVNEHKQKKAQAEQFFLIYEIGESGANINTNYSEQFLQNILSCKSENFTPLYQIFRYKGQQKNDLFVAFVLLPAMFTHVVIQSTVCDNPQNAKASGALEACKKLYEDGHIKKDLSNRSERTYGLHMGADQDDFNIYQSQEYTTFMNEETKQFILQDMIGMKSFSYRKVYYRQKNKELFEFKQLNEVSNRIYEQLTIEYEGRLFILLTSEEQILWMLLSLKKNFIVREKKKITQAQAKQFNQNYLMEAIRLLDLSQNQQVLENEDKYGSLKFYISDKPLQSILFLQETDLAQFKKIIQSIILGIKSQHLLDKITKEINMKTSQRECQVAQNVLIMDRQKYASLLKIELSFTPKAIQQPLEENWARIPQYQENLKQSIEKSLLPYELDRLFINLIKRESSAYLSATFVKNQLLVNSKISKYLLNTKSQNPVEYIPGIYIVEDQYDCGLTDEDKKQSTITQCQGLVNFSTQQIANFLFSLLGEQYQYDDSRFSQSLQLLRQLKVFEDESFETPIQSVAQFINFCNQMYRMDHIICSSQRYKDLQTAIGYQFQHFNLLFQALTDISFKHEITERQFYQGFQKNTQQIDVSNESQINSFFDKIKQLNGIQIQEFSNDFLSFLGQNVFNLITSLFIKEQNFQDPDLVTVAYAAVKDEKYQAFLATRLKLGQSLLASVEIKKAVSQTETVLNLGVNQIFKVRRDNTGVKCLSLAFKALIGAIFIDLQGDFNILLSWFRSFAVQQNILDFIHPSSIEKRYHFKFLKWYREAFPQQSPMYFDLIKTPNLEFKRNRNTYIPFDKATGRLVNVYQDQGVELEDLSIICENKRDAWDFLFRNTFQSRQQKYDIL